MRVKEEEYSQFPRSNLANRADLLCLLATIPGVARCLTTRLRACCLPFLHLCLYQLPVDLLASDRRWIVICYHRMSGFLAEGGLVPSIVMLVAVLFGLASLPAAAQTTNAIQVWPTKPIT